MGVLIKDMEIPKNCFECKLRDGMGKDCGKAIFHCVPLEKWIVPNSLEKADDCPLIEDSFTDIAYIPSVTTVWGDGEAPTYALQKRGKWIEYGEPNAQGQYEAWYYYCSLCGQVGIKQYNYCPNCGAQMESEEENG